MKTKRILIKFPCESKEKCPVLSMRAASRFRPSAPLADAPVQLPEQLLAQIILNNPHATSISSLEDSRYLDVNAAWLEATGCQHHQVIGQLVKDIGVDDGLSNREALIKDISKASSGPFSLLDRYQSCRLTEAGQLRTVLWTTSVLWEDERSTAWVVNIGTDITQQRIAENRLRESKARLRSVLENANGVIFTLSSQGTFLFVSQGWTEILGHDTNEVQGQHFKRFIHQDHINEVYEVFCKMVASGQPVKGLEYQIRHRDGSWRWNSCSAGVARGESGYVLFYVGMATDITERKQMEQALRLTEKTLSKTFYVNPDPISITTLGEGVYVDVNQAFLDISGYERSEVIGHSFFDLNIWENPEERQRIIAHVQSREYSLLDEEVRLRMKSGEIRTFLYSSALIDIGGTNHLLSACRDISDRKSVEEALRLSEDKFSKAFNASPTPLCIATLEEGRFTAVNESFCRLMGYEPNELLGKTSFEINLWVEPFNRSFIQDQIAKKEPARNMELCFRCKNGSLRLGSYFGEVIEVDGKVCLLSIITDITTQKQAEAQIKYLSFHDKLTGLYNRAYFEEELSRLDAGGELPLSLIMGDVNGLKLINDALGHQEGDKILTAVSALLKEHCRSKDIIARWGGDEFIILLPGCTSCDAEKIIERIKNAGMLVDTIPIQVSISLGLATKNHSDQDIRDLIKEAEDKMYRHKLLESRSTRNHFLSSLEKTLWARSHETQDHCERMQRMARRIGQIVELPESEMDNLKLLAALHDIGKIAIPNSILDKPGKLTEEEWDTIKKHPEIGYRIALSSPEMAPIAQAILHHHERWDGTGYPLGLGGDDIPFLSRIIAIVDAYDVMVNGRPYQKTRSSQEAWDEITRCAGSQFDPHLVESIAELIFEPEELSNN